MEIVSGILRGLELFAPDGMTTRPTAVRSRKALFDSLGDLSGKMAADIFAGSGALGLEAASRGAASVVFADNSPRALKAIRRNTDSAVKHGCTARFEILDAELPAASKRLAAMPVPDVIFADPPYAESMTLLNRLFANEEFTRWSRNAVLIWEAPQTGGMLPPPEPWKIENIRMFGAAKFLFFRTKPMKEN